MRVSATQVTLLKEPIASMDKVCYSVARTGASGQAPYIVGVKATCAPTGRRSSRLAITTAVPRLG
jgi:hypothetical protein